MWKLKTPKLGDCRAEIDLALGALELEPGYELDDKHIDEILVRYNEYHLLHGNPHISLRVLSIGAKRLSTMNKAYSQVQEKGVLKDLRSRLKQNAKKCPYCGFLPITDLDHHLPKSKYGALSIFSYNLVPCCSTCNTKKSTNAGSTPDKQFSHVYFSELPKQRFLRASASMHGDALVMEFEIVCTSKMGAAEFQRLGFQFKKLELNLRYQEALNDYLSAHKFAIEQSGDVSPRVLKNLLLRTFRATCKSYGRNHWYSAVWHALYKCDAFCSAGYATAFGQATNEEELV